MFSLSNTIDDFEKEVEYCSNYYLISFGILFLISLISNVFLGGTVIYLVYKNNIPNTIPINTELINTETNSVGITVDIGETKIKEIELTRNNPIYKRQNLPDWVIQEYLDQKKELHSE